jgi:hypothetical protein
MIFHFRKKIVVNPQPAIALYRRCMRVVQQLQPHHQKTWYDYVRLKYSENSSLTDDRAIKKKISSAYEELEWLQSVLDRQHEFSKKP